MSEYSNAWIDMRHYNALNSAMPDVSVAHVTGHAVASGAGGHVGGEDVVGVLANDPVGPTASRASHG